MIRARRTTILATLALGAATPAIARLQRGSVDDGVAEVLGSVGSWSDVPDRARSLVELGPGAVPLLFDLLVAAESGDEAEGGTRFEPAVGAQATLRLAVLRSALRAEPADVMRPFLARLADGVLGDAESVAGMGLLGRFGGVGDLALLARLAAAPEEGTGDALGRRTAFTRAAEEMLRSDRAGWSRLPDAVAPLPAELRGPLVEAIGRQRQRPGAALATLARMLGSVPELDAVILVEVSRLAPAVRAREGGADPLAIGDRETGLARARIRTYLLDPDPHLVTLAAVACANLDDREGIEDLVTAASRDERGIAVVAGDALGRLTGLRFGADAAAWAEWYWRETDWWRWRAGDATVALRDGSAAEAQQALSELAGLRLHPQDVVALLALGLDRAEPEVVATACRALANLRSVAPLTALVDLLDDARPRVRASAHDALGRLTDLRLPPRSEIWAERLAVRPLAR